MLKLREREYKPYQTIVKILGHGDNKKIKIITMNILRTAGLDIDTEKLNNRCTVNDKKLNSNISRAKNKIFEYAFCNNWDWFFTGTLNPNNYDRSDLDKFHKDLVKWFSNIGKKYNTKINFLLIPELHSDLKSWHIHGLLAGVPFECLSPFRIGDRMSKYLVDRVLNGFELYNWLDYSNKFGFCDLEPIKSLEGVSKYITKYITKNLFNSVTELNAHLYYHSRGLNLGTVIKKGTMLPINIVPQFENDYCSITTLDYNKDFLDYLLDNIL